MVLAAQHGRGHRFESRKRWYGLSEWRSGKIDVNISVGHLLGRGFDSWSNPFLM
jgi:hypothetical protein